MWHFMSFSVEPPLFKIQGWIQAYLYSFLFLIFYCQQYNFNDHCTLATPSTHPHSTTTTKNTRIWQTYAAPTLRSLKQSSQARNRVDSPTHPRILPICFRVLSDLSRKQTRIHPHPNTHNEEKVQNDMLLVYISNNPIMLVKHLNHLFMHEYPMHFLSPVSSQKYMGKKNAVYFNQEILCIATKSPHLYIPRTQLFHDLTRNDG